MDLFDLVAKITLDTSEYERGLGDAEKKTGGFGEKLKSGLATAGKVAAAGLAVAGTAVVSLGKQAIEAYADYEQLVGGVETLFGSNYKTIEEYISATGASLQDASYEFEAYQNRQQDVLNNAANAYKTAGLSANEYMETVTGFAAALNSSLGEYAWQSANYADMAITDMADNANKMGSSIEAIQNAYAGFSKQNYTMLDNLKLGYGGTKEEMERLLRDAEKLEGFSEGALDVSNFADIVDAIHIVQENMGITGTTAKEASTTISGSLASMKSAWHNLVVGVADENADFETLVGNFTESVGTAAENILPRIGIALQGIGQLVKGLAPVIAQAIPTLVSDVLPTLLDSATTLLMTVVNTLVENLPMLFDVGLQAIMTLADALIVNLPTLIPALVNVIMTIVDKLTEPDTIVLLVDSALKLIMALASGLIQAIPRLVEKIPVIIANLLKAIYEAFPMIIRAGLDLVMSLGRGLVDGIASLGKSIWNVTESIRNGIKQVVDSALNWGRDLISNFIGGIKQKASDLWSEVKNIAGGIASFLGFSEPEKGPLSNFHTYAPDMMKLFAKGIRDNEHLITDQIDKSFNFGNDISNVGLSANGFSNGGVNNHFGAVSINIYPHENQSADEIAEAVMFRIQDEYDRKAAALT
jgi:phage-related protein